MRWLALTFSLLLAGCAAPVVVDHRSGADFDDYQNYAIVSPDSDRESLSLDSQRIEEALRQQLKGHPLTAATSADTADLLVRYRLVPIEKFKGSSFQFGLGWFGSGYGVSTTTPVEGETSKEYKLQVALVDRVDKQVVWEATSRDTLYPDLDSQKRRDRINTMVAEMLKRYPPDANAN